MRALFFLMTKEILCNFINPSASQIYPRLQTTENKLIPLEAWL